MDGRGGWRPGSGRPAAGSEQAEETASFNKERTRHEKIKADQRELALEIERGNYLPRDAQRAGAATALSVLTQSLRSIPDNVEREFALPPEVVEGIARQIDAALDEVAKAFKAMTKDV